MKKVMAMGAALALLAVCLLAGCGKKEELSTEIVVDGVHFTVFAVDDNPMFAPGGMEEGHVPFDVALKYTLDDGANYDSSMKKLDSGVRFVTPDGTEYKIGMSYTAADENIHGYFTGVPEGTDISALVMVYDKQRMALA